MISFVTIFQLGIMFQMQVPPDHIFEIGESQYQIEQRLEAEQAAYEEEMAAYYVEPIQEYSAPTYYEAGPDGVLTRSGGVNSYNGNRETYYNLDMSGVVANAQAAGINGTYGVRADGVKTYGGYVIVADGMGEKYGQVIDTSLGQGIVLDACPGGSTDIATTW